MTAVLDAPLTAAPTAMRARRLLRGRPDDPVWVRPSLAGLLAVTAVLYLWGLGASGWANAFYSAAVQAMSENWTAFFFGSSDAANSITVDKPPAALWVMALSVRLFGLSSWSVLVPQALIGVATVAVLYLAVRRVAGPAAGLGAGAAMALTPVAVLMFRFDNPDALLVLLLTAAAYAVTRAVETASARWLALVGVLVGFAFLTKMLQALLVVPAFALVYLIAAPTTFGRRIAHLAGAGLALLVSAGWWVAVVELVPSSMRPYIGGSQTNSVWELIWGYNGLGRLTGDETGSVGGGAGWGETGLLRLVNTEIGGQVAWLLPAALALLVAGFVAVGRTSRLDPRRAALITWGGWLVVTGLTFSLMAGIFHAYYTVALAPAIAALVGIGGALLWRRRGSVWARFVLALVVGGTALWSWVLLHRTPDFLPWLQGVVLGVGLVAAAVLLISDQLGRRVAAGVLVVGMAAGLGGPAAYALDTADTPHSGSIPSAGPTVTGGFGPVRAGFPGGGTTAPFAGLPFPGGPRTGTGFGFGRAVGGLLNASSVSADVVAALSEDASSYTWVAATVGANNAAGYQLATELPVMPIGGFNGSDPSPTLAEFQAHVAADEIHWFISGGIAGGAAGGSNAASEIRAWVTATFPSTQVGGVTLYDLGSGA